MIFSKTIGSNNGNFALFSQKSASFLLPNQPNIK